MVDDKSPNLHQGPTEGQGAHVPEAWLSTCLLAVLEAVEGKIFMTLDAKPVLTVSHNRS